MTDILSFVGNAIWKLPEWSVALLLMIAGCFWFLRKVGEDYVDFRLWVAAAKKRLEKADASSDESSRHS